MQMVKIDKTLAAQALQTLQAKVGGTIRGRKLYPLKDYFADLIVPEPVQSLNRQSYLAQVEPQQEMDVQKRLRDVGMDVYCPLQSKKVRVHAHRHRTVKRPLMPGYVFPIFDEIRDRWQTIRPFDVHGGGIKGIVRLFMILERPVPIPSAVMQHIQRKEVEEAVKQGKAPPIVLKVGSVVRILEPFAFTGLFGTVVKTNQTEWLVDVEIDIFGRMVPLSLTPEQVEVI